MGINVIAVKLDWKFGLPNVPIIPFVFDSQLKISKPNLCANAYKDDTKPLNESQKMMKLELLIFERTLIQSMRIITEKKVEKPNPLPVLPKNSCSKGASLKSITITI